MINQSRILTKSLAVAVALLSGGTIAFAEPSPVGTLNLNTNSYSDASGGGEFTVSSITGAGLSDAGYSSLTKSGANFTTFCMAYNQEFVPNNTFGYFLSNTTYGNAGNANVPLTQGVAYLYSQFATGSLANYDYSNTNNGTFTSRLQAAEDLQVAIWYFSGEDALQGAPAPNSTDNYYVNLVEGLNGGGAAGLAWGTTTASNDFDGVQILVLTNSNSNDGSTPNSQPQLYYSSVPDNGITALLIGASLLGLAIFKRRLRSAGSK